MRTDFVHMNGDSVIISPIQDPQMPSMMHLASFTIYWEQKENRERWQMQVDSWFEGVYS